MAEPRDYIRESRWLRVAAAQSRAQAIQAQLSVGFVFCKMAKTGLSYGRIDIACTLIQKLRHIAQTVEAHLAEPNHVLPGQVDQLHDELVRLESQILNLEQATRG